MSEQKGMTPEDAIDYIDGLRFTIRAQEARIKELEAQIHNDAIVKEACHQMIAELEKRQITPEIMAAYWRDFPHDERSARVATILATFEQNLNSLRKQNIEAGDAP